MRLGGSLVKTRARRDPPPDADPRLCQPEVVCGASEGGSPAPQPAPGAHPRGPDAPGSVAPLGAAARGTGRLLGPTRRQLLLAGAAAPLLLHVSRALPAAALEGVDVRPRSTWGGDLLPKGPLYQEAPGDVRFLLVHHTASSNAYTETDVPGLLRGIYGYHTSSTKGWPDIAYNFLVDRFGRVWEGRTGSLDGPVKGDATGGSQGFALLACFLGDHTSQAPSAAAQAAMGRLLGALAGRCGIDVSPGATATFTSRGSSRYPTGTVVTTSTVSGHRDMSFTMCPGDAC